MTPNRDDTVDIQQDIQALREDFAKRLAAIEAKLVASEAPAEVDWSTVKPGTLEARVAYMVA